MRDLLQTRFRERNDDLQPDLRQLEDRALCRLEIAAQKQENRLTGYNGATRTTLESAAATRGVAVEINRRMLSIVRRVYA